MDRLLHITAVLDERPLDRLFQKGHVIRRYLLSQTLFETFRWIGGSRGADLDQFFRLYQAVLRREDGEEQVVLHRDPLFRVRRIAEEGQTINYFFEENYGLVGS